MRDIQLVLFLVSVVFASAGLALPSPGLAAPAPGAGSIAAGGGHTCLVTSSGAVKCWGANGHGQLGDGTMTGRAEPVVVSALSGIARVAAGLDSTCAVSTAGALSCWGDNSSGQLGDGGTADRATPGPVQGLGSGVQDVALGSAHACAVTPAGGVKCWGDNSLSQLGDGTTTNHETPVDVVGLTGGVAALASGGFHTCALTSAGAVKCWGDNVFGQLGDGSTTSRDAPVDVTGLSSGVVAISVGSGGDTCAALELGGMKCWGNNEYGQLGEDRGCPTPCTTPVDVQGLAEHVSEITAGYYFTCALSASGGAKCWGINQLGQIGDDQACGMLCGTPQDVSGLTAGVVTMAAGLHHSCARTAGGLLCWGDNVSGQLGDGGECGPICPAPVAVPGAQDAAPGDANCDRATNSIDSAVILQFVAGLLASLPCAAPADVNGDGQATAVDAALILQYEAGLIHSLPP